MLNLYLHIVSNLLEDGFCCFVLALLEIAVGLESREKEIKLIVQNMTKCYRSCTEHRLFCSRFCLRTKNQNFYLKMQDKIWNGKSGFEFKESTRLFKVLATLGSSEPSSDW